MFLRECWVFIVLLFTSVLPCLGQEIIAMAKDTFRWPSPADIVYVRGGLSSVAVYAVDLVETLAFTKSFTDPSLPAGGAGFYYLVRPNCAVGSWQTTVGAEPERDQELP